MSKKRSVNIAAENELFAFRLMSYVIFSRDLNYVNLQEEVRSTYETLRRSQEVLGTLGHVP